MKKQILNLTKAQFKGLEAIELRGKRVVYSDKYIDDIDGKALDKVRKSWRKYVTKLGLDPFDKIAYTCTDLGKDFSHGYDFSDAIC
jgi:hypothetical protein